MSMNVGSLFSGIGGLDHGLANAGFTHRFFCENDPWRRRVLAEHWPGVPIYDDVRSVGRLQPRRDGGHGAEPSEISGWGAPRHLDLLCGGFPCQDLSVAGQRAGLMHEGGRSNLFFEFARIIDALRPRFVLVENVPGLLSSNGGRDFGIVLGTLADLGYGMGWRTLDSRFFGVPQRRRRVFILATVAVGDPRAAAERVGEVLAVGTRCTGHPATSGETRENAADASDVGFALRRDPGGVGQGHNTNYVASLSGLGNGGPDVNGGQAERLVAPALTRNYGKQPDNSDTNLGPMLVAAPLTSGGHPNSNMPGRRKEDDVNLAVTGFHMTQDPISNGEFTPAMGKGNSEGCATIAVGIGTGVRRLTPVECERLQALPDNWTAYGPDSRRYSALGDAVTATVGEWIGRRIIEHG